MPENPDFIAAMLQEFCSALDALVDEEIAPDDCLEPIVRMVGRPVTPEKLAALALKGQKKLCAAFTEWFECAIELDAIQEAIEATLARWPSS